MMCSLFATAVWASEGQIVEGYVEEDPEEVDLTPEEYYDPDGAVEDYGRTVYSDEYGDYLISMPSGDKMYIRLNPETRVVVGEHDIVFAYDADGNRLDFEIDVAEHPWIMELMKEHDASMTVPEGAITEGTNEYTEPVEGSDGSAGTASNPNTGVALSVIPAILATLALIFKKR